MIQKEDKVGSEQKRIICSSSYKEKSDRLKTAYMLRCTHTGVFTYVAPIELPLRKCGHVQTQCCCTVPVRSGQLLVHLVRQSSHPVQKSRNSERSST